jgi:hypothetical protein
MTYRPQSAKTLRNFSRPHETKGCSDGSVVVLGMSVIQQRRKRNHGVVPSVHVTYADGQSRQWRLRVVDTPPCNRVQPIAIQAAYSRAIDAHLVFMDAGWVFVLYPHTTRAIPFGTQFLWQTCALSPEGTVLAVFGVGRKRVGTKMVNLVLLNFYMMTGNDYRLLHSSRFGSAEEGDDGAGSENRRLHALAWSTDGTRVAVATSTKVIIIEYATRFSRLHATVTPQGGEPGSSREVSIRFIDTPENPDAVLLVNGTGFHVIGRHARYYVSSWQCAVQISPFGNLTAGIVCVPSQQYSSGVQLIDPVNAVLLAVKASRPIDRATVGRSDAVRVRWSPNQEEIAVLFTDGALRVYTVPKMHEISCTFITNPSPVTFDWVGPNRIVTISQQMQEGAMCSQFVTLRPTIGNRLRMALYLGNHRRNADCVLFRLSGETLRSIITLANKGLADG